ncbi:hypothetical protein [Chroococcidiopsis sp. CCMEE 29]|uniref:hypothetical protein n=1 Tax=Chroococcidiopsis sp. CCMEE 29 TaxID=155894 RepID=UPI0020202E19|nr:hypothetical protein [Chroococcidiopsis sp. CCMEE 29]
MQATDYLQDLIRSLSTAIYDTSIETCNDINTLNEIRVLATLVADAADMRIFEIEPEPLEPEEDEE